MGTVGVGVWVVAGYDWKNLGTIPRHDPWDCHRTAAPLTPKTTPTDQHI